MNENNELINKDKTIKGFKIRAIKECSICGKKHTTGVREMVTEWWGIGECSGCREFCEECFHKNTFQNSNLFTFLKIKDKLFCYKPYWYLDFGFRPIYSESDIDRAFNPERYEFDGWLNK